MSEAGKEYWSTTAVVLGRDGEETVDGYGDDYKVGDKVQYFYHDRYHRGKMRK